MKRSTFSIIGSGWRAEYFARCAQALPDHFGLLSFVTTNQAKATAFLQAFGVPSFETLEDMLAQQSPDYVVLSVAAEAAPGVLLRLAERGVAVLMETPAAPSMEALLQMHSSLPGGARVQVAEQYFLRPVQQAHLRVIAGGKLGSLSEARVSLTGDYHSVSLLRKYLGVGFANARIVAHQFPVRGFSGYGREGTPDTLECKEYMHTIAVLEYPDCAAIFDNEDMQHRSFIRTSQIHLKGETGEILEDRIRYLINHKTPMESRLIRVTMGEDANIEGYGLKGIVADGEWVYRNPFPDSRLVDDEIAVAETMLRMARYLQSGESFYSLAEASQDIYLALLIRQACKEQRPLQSVSQSWARI